MTFSSTIFLFAFLPLVLGLYYLAGKNLRNYVLLAGSLVFYAWGETEYFYVIVLIALVNYVLALLLENYRGAKKILLPVTVVLNIATLTAFKYLGFFTQIAENVSGVDIQLKNSVLPLGISFFSLQALSYSIDVANGKIKAQHSFHEFALYICLFPKLVSGPFVRYGDLAPQISRREETLDKFTAGAKRFTIGLFKKAVFADTLQILVDKVFSTETPVSVVAVWLGATAYALQLYYDFSGYSDMALGLGKMFGFDLPENFNYPYAAMSVREFWNRWHMTLGAWFKEYVYYPIVTSKRYTIINRGVRKHLGVGVSRVFSICFPLVITWILTGLWHGGSCNYLVWGLYFAVIIILENLGLGAVLKKTPKAVQHAYVVLIILISRVIVKTGSLAECGEYLAAMFGFGSGGFCDEMTLGYLAEFKILMPICAVFCLPVVPKISERLKNLKSKPLLDTLAYTILLVVGIAFAVTSGSTPFIYANF